MFVHLTFGRLSFHSFCFGVVDSQAVPIIVEDANGQRNVPIAMSLLTQKSAGMNPSAMTYTGHMAKSVGGLRTDAVFVQNWNHLIGLTSDDAAVQGWWEGFISKPMENR